MNQHITQFHSQFLKNECKKWLLLNRDLRDNLFRIPNHICPVDRNKYNIVFSKNITRFYSNNRENIIWMQIKLIFSYLSDEMFKVRALKKLIWPYSKFENEEKRIKFKHTLVLIQTRIDVYSMLTKRNPISKLRQEWNK